eukprot:5613701-Pleurochrysis_carterae.AAC.1
MPRYTSARRMINVKDVWPSSLRLRSCSSCQVGATTSYLHTRMPRCILSPRVPSTCRAIRTPPPAKLPTDLPTH